MPYETATTGGSTWANTLYFELGLDGPYLEGRLPDAPMFDVHLDGFRYTSDSMRCVARTTIESPHGPVPEWLWWGMAEVGCTYVLVREGLPDPDQLFVLSAQQARRYLDLRGLTEQREGV
jgi:hypothetical protein